MTKKVKLDFSFQISIIAQERNARSLPHKYIDLCAQIICSQHSTKLHQFVSLELTQDLYFGCLASNGTTFHNNVLNFYSFDKFLA